MIRRVNLWLDSADVVRHDVWVVPDTVIVWLLFSILMFSKHIIDFDHT